MKVRETEKETGRDVTDRDGARRDGMETREERNRDRTET